MAASREIADALSQWAAVGGRKTPWRASSDPYILGVAEILLQKTKAEDTEPVWRKVVSAHPDPDAMVSTSDEDLLAIVSKLGLGNQRVQRLKAMARAMRLREGGRKVPGLGSYGSAIVDLAQQRDPDTPPVDGNIARVICRLRGFSFVRGEPRKKVEVKQAVTKLLL